MNGIHGLGGLRPYGPGRDLKPLRGVDPLKDVDAQAADDDAKLKGWTAKVGEGRARAALELLKTPGGQGGRSTTLPELLTELYLRGRGVRYESQVDLGWSRPDFVVFEATAAPGGVLVLRVQGDYWHGGKVAYDEAQRGRLLQATVRGLPVLKVIDVWESRVYEGDGVLDAALRGEEVGQ